jgi:hypothetical protein
MAQLFGGQAFDANAVEPNAPREVIAPGDYKVMIVSSAMKDNKAGTGSYLELEMDILDGENQGRKIWDLLNLDNPNPKAVEIAERTLSAICRAVGVWNCTDSEQLHGRAMIASVKVDPAKDGYEAKNSVKGYKPLSDAMPQPSAQQPAQQTTAQPAATGGAPWRKP